MKSSDIHNRAISQEMPQPSITKICLKIVCLKFHSNFPGANELTKIFFSVVNRYSLWATVHGLTYVMRLCAGSVMIIGNNVWVSILSDIGKLYVYNDDVNRSAQIGGLVQDFSIFIANAPGILQSCTKPSIYPPRT